MKDLFEHYEEMPNHIAAIVNRFFKRDGETYESCEQLVAELEQEGYTCDYGLDASPYNLRKL